MMNTLTPLAAHGTLVRPTTFAPTPARRLQALACALCLLVGGTAASLAPQLVLAQTEATAVVNSQTAPAPAPAPAPVREGVQVGGRSQFSKLVPAEQIEQAAAQQYVQMQSQARAKGALAPDNHPQVIRLRSIAERLIPYSTPWNPRAKNWRWEVILLQSEEINAFCMPGGKIAFYTGIIEKLKLTDDEVAMIMGHEISHALREHARERMGKSTATRIGANLLSGLLGLGNTGDVLLNMGGQLLTLKFSRQDESEADLVGMELAARAGYDPRAGVTLWQKMGAASKGAPPQFLSTHPASSTRIQEIQAALPSVLPLYNRASKPQQRFDNPRRTGHVPLGVGQVLAYWGAGTVGWSHAEGPSSHVHRGPH